MKKLKHREAKKFAYALLPGKERARIPVQSVFIWDLQTFTP